MSHYLVDSHCHLHDHEWFTPEQAEDFLQQAHLCHVDQVVVIGTDPADSAQAQFFAATHQDVFWTYGIHPDSANRLAEWLSADAEFFTKIRTALASQPCTQLFETSATSITTSPALTPVAIGEIGLDYHYDQYDRTAQLQLFERMLQLARDLQLPVSLHIRGHAAFADAWALLDNFPELTGVVHSFTGSKHELKRALARDFYVGVNGLATYSTIALPPLEKMLLETDAPFLTPVPFRGTINKPGYVCDIAAYLATNLGVSEEKIAEQTTNNVRELFKLGDPILQKGQ